MPGAMARSSPALAYKGLDHAGKPIFKGKSRHRVKSPATINRYIAALSAVLTWAVEERLTPKGWKNPCRGIKRMPEPDGRVRFLDEDERNRVFAATSASKYPRLYALVLTAMLSGARRGELLSLRWDDVDLERGVAQLSRSKNGDRRALVLLPQVVAALRPFASDAGKHHNSVACRARAGRREELQVPRPAALLRLVPGAGRNGPPLGFPVGHSTLLSLAVKRQKSSAPSTCRSRCHVVAYFLHTAGAPFPKMPALTAGMQPTGSTPLRPQSLRETPAQLRVLMFGTAQNGPPSLHITGGVTVRHASGLAAAAPVRVLVVDDSSEIRVALCKWLSAFPGVGWIAHAASAIEALSGLQDTRPHLVLTNVEMPEMSGFDLARRLTAMPDGPRVVVMSLSNSRDYQTLTRWSGADAFIDKLDLYEALSHYLSAVLSPAAE